MINFEYRGGRVAGAPELKETKNGTPYLRFRLANDDQVYNQDTKEWDKRGEHFITVLVWPAKRKGGMVNLPAMLAANLNSGNSVQVYGKFGTRSWEAEDGSKRSVEEFTARSVAIDTLDVLPWEEMQGSSQQAQQQNQGGFSGAQQASQSQGASWGDPAPVGGAAPY